MQTKTQPEQQADQILKEWAHSHHQSLRKAGIIDERRERTVREREIAFADFFGRKRNRNDEV
jgi:hypothetical protein